MIKFLQLGCARLNEFPNRHEFLSAEGTVAETDTIVVTDRELDQRTGCIQVIGPHALKAGSLIPQDIRAGIAETSTHEREVDVLAMKAQMRLGFLLTGHPHVVVSDICASLATTRSPSRKSHANQGQ